MAALLERIEETRLDVSRELNGMLGKLPRMRRITKRVDEQ